MNNDIFDDEEGLWNINANKKGFLGFVDRFRLFWGRVYTIVLFITLFVCVFMLIHRYAFKNINSHTFIDRDET